jgi:hypothetical protein
MQVMSSTTQASVNFYATKAQDRQREVRSAKYQDSQFPLSHHHHHTTTTTTANTNHHRHYRQPPLCPRPCCGYTVFSLVTGRSRYRGGRRRCRGGVGRA